MTSPPHKLIKRYNGESPDVLQQLRSDGYDTTWYTKATDRPEAKVKPQDKCGYFTVFYLEADTAYTINNDGSKYLKYRTLRRSEAKPCWYCEACKTRFDEWDQANEHRNGKAKQ